MDPHGERCSGQGLAGVWKTYSRPRDDRKRLCQRTRYPRWLYVLPNGDVLVAETNAPPKPEDEEGLRGWTMKRMMNTAGAGVPSAYRMTLLRAADGDGLAAQGST
jgi:glucose/arabinose dehydrogenase